MKKIVVLIPVHCAPKVVMMTLGTWLEATDGSYKADVVLGVHENYHHYHKGLARLEELPVRLSKVKEINWCIQDPAENLLRYSKMHATNLMTMMQMVKDQEFDYLAILDHDLIFKQDFLGYAMGTGKDLVGSYMDDRKAPLKMQTGIGWLTFVPKFSIWHLMMSSKFFQELKQKPALMLPVIRDGKFYDTFTQAVEKNQSDWDLSVQELSKNEMASMIQHKWSMSFNFGPMMSGNKEYNSRIAKAESEYNMKFPKGIKHLFEKVQ